MDRLVGIKGGGGDEIVINYEGLRIFTSFFGENGFVGDIGGNVYKFTPIFRDLGEGKKQGQG